MRPILLCILDGFGEREEVKGNAIKAAHMPNYSYLKNNYPSSLLEASGEAVGLPKGQMGNSEIGHSNIGAGRVLYGPLMRINNSIKDGSFFKNKNILKTIGKSKGNKLHIMGLLSDGGIHSHINHLMALLDLVKSEGIKEVYIHAFTDGRDTLPNVSIKYFDRLQNKLNELGIGKIASISGRYYAMDRDNRWDRINKTYDVIVNGKGDKYNNYKEAINANYSKGITDEFIVPCLLDENGKLKNGDSVIIFNFRPDRLRELGMSLTNKEFKEFETKDININLLTMMSVSDDVICTNAFDEIKINNTLGQYLAKQGYKQLRIAETEKYAHVTYFFDGGVEQNFVGEKKILIPSPHVATYDLKPEMSAYEITDRLLTEIDNYDFILLNFANSDMVGHTGNYEATIKALEAIDKCIGVIYKKVLEKNGIFILTADHGNSDYMIDENNNEVTSHSVSKVPFIVTLKDIKLKCGALPDIAPTILKLFSLEVPKEMKGNILIK